MWFSEIIPVVLPVFEVALPRGRSTLGAFSAWGYVAPIVRYDYCSGINSGSVNVVTIHVMIANGPPSTT